MSHSVELEVGVSSPLGASVVGEGVNFAVYAPQAQHMSLCLFDSSGHSEVLTLAMHMNEGGIWTLKVSPLKSGALYGFRADGEYAPEKGLFFNNHKLLLDPYARDLYGEFTWSERHYGQMPVGKLSQVNNAIDMPKSRVRELAPYTGKKPNHCWGKTVIYECHVVGATCRHPEIPKPLQGKFLGLSHPSFIEHLRTIGVTCLELLPVHAFISEQFLTAKGLQNYWGYNTLNFFTPHKEYLVNDDISEFQEMVAALHKADIEVILDVVYNHTAEAGTDGPILSLRGLDNLGYYRTVADKPQHYINDTGCGNTVNIDSPRSLQLVLDSLRYWVEVMGVDGFRFDLATILARNPNGFNQAHAFFQAINQDPVLSQVKLIAEPWDIGPGGYQLGAFPAPWREWNDKYRDTIRRFWKQEQGVIGELAKRLHGSFDLFEHNLRGPLNSINFITSHDGFTLADLVSYEHKHNEANGEQNRDGHSGNHSFNCGVEGFTNDPQVSKLRLQQQKNMLLTLLLSKGVPMLSLGSEMAHSQGGNNNAYCQNNRTSWLAWKDSQFSHPLTRFIDDVLRIRKQFSIFKHRFFVHDNDPRYEVAWFTESGSNMQQDDWHQGDRQVLIYSLTDKHTNQALLIILNAGAEPVTCQLPSLEKGKWQLALTSIHPMSTQFVDKEHQIAAMSSWVFTANSEDLNHG
ncbi:MULTISPECIES: glycogen debranching protein GlgX [Pseudoalteromonas]|uniref:glycogen debranching protein GlgX n=1 Tax=Pseudoalteromonas TaxID=53246 RepID=UPI0006DBEB40|nr:MULTISPECIES: glycogen debranching protein GlgX [Pseudoalteromonas]KPW00395.1 Glycogen debranching enzyme [Pseudoalteromonas sp. P1-8]MCG9735327.1 glycogen debranching protein GlgX [Pseudoalteromonas shioyasakiensis]